MKYAFFGTDGRIESAHNDETIEDAPRGAYLLTDKQWENRFDLMLVDGALKSSPLKTTDDSSAKRIRAERDKKLSATDWLMLSDSPVPTDKRADVEQYRQALRDVTGQHGFPEQVEWPEYPL